MGIDLLQSLECLTQQDDRLELTSRDLRSVEYQLALTVTGCLSEGGWSASAAIERLLEFCPDELPLAAIHLSQGTHGMATRAQRLRAWFVAKLRWGEAQQRARAEQATTAYQVDDEFVRQVAQAVSDLDRIHQHGKPVERLAWKQTCRSIRESALFGRSVFVGLRALWNEEESSEPILWRIGAALASLAEVGSDFAITEAMGLLVILGLARLMAKAKTDTLRDFVAQANDDANGNLLDNLVLAERTYQDLVADGWEPDRWEIENLPISIDLFLRFMTQAGLEQREEIDHRLEINLSEAQENYRYSGSPFLSSDDCKKVVVLAPGWVYQGELVVRPKVREATQ